LLRDASLDTNVVTQEKKKLKTAALKLTLHQPLFFFVYCSFFSFFCFSSKNFLIQQQDFFEQQELLLFFLLLFFLSLSLFFSSNTKYIRLWNKMILKSIEYLEQPQAQIWAKVSGGSGDDQL
jgi:hypothetical protein